jgi:predicted Zn-ribbon and HTH transcriptional regulator
MKLSRNVISGSAALGALLVIVLGLLIFAASTAKKTGTRSKDPTVCEFCGGTSFNKAGECPACMASMGIDAYRAKRESKNWYNSPAIAAVVIILLCILFLVHIVLLLRKFSWKKEVVVYYYVRCTKCGRKLRYKSSQINHLGRCPLCHKPILFPKPPEGPRDNTWRKLVHYVWG